MKINEIADMRTPDVKEITEMLLRNCQPYLSEIDGNIQKHIMWRGLSGATVRDFGSKQAHLSDRENLNTPKKVHDEMNEWFTEHYEHPWRNGVFVSGQESQARVFGLLTLGGHRYENAYVIFPIGNFEYLWNPGISDMYHDLIIANFQYIPQLMDLMNKKHKFKTDDLKEALHKDIEIIVWVKEYYYLEPHLLPEIGKFLQ